MQEERNDCDPREKSLNRRLFIHCSEFPPGPGGIGTHAHALASYFSRNGWLIKVLAPQDYACLNDVLQFNKSQRYEINTISRRKPALLDGLSRLAKLREIAGAWKPAVALASGERAVWLCAIACAAKRVPWMAVGHGSEFGLLHPLERLITRWSFAKANVVVCVSEFTKKQMFDFGIRPRRAVVIPNGADPEIYHPILKEEVEEFRKSLGLDAARIILTVGSVTERKGQDIVIRALPAILRECPNVHYLMVGLPKCKEDLDRLAQELGVGSHVHFAGALPKREVVRAYNAAEVFVLTSRRTSTGDVEGYGIAVIEAAFCGLPAVVSKNCGLAEAVAEGKTGILVPQEDPPATAAAVVRLIKDRALRDSLAKKAKETAERECTWSRMGREYEKILLSLTQRTSQPA